MGSEMCIRDRANAGATVEEAPDPKIPVAIDVRLIIFTAVVPDIVAALAAVLKVIEPLFLLLVIYISTGSYPACSTVKVNSDLRDN